MVFQSVRDSLYKFFSFLEHPQWNNSGKLFPMGHACAHNLFLLYPIQVPLTISLPWNNSFMVLSKSHQKAYVVISYY